MQASLTWRPARPLLVFSEVYMNAAAIDLVAIQVALRARSGRNIKVFTEAKPLRLSRLPISDHPARRLTRSNAYVQGRLVASKGLGSSIYTPQQ